MTVAWLTVSSDSCRCAAKARRLPRAFTGLQMCSRCWTANIYHIPLMIKGYTGSEGTSRAVLDVRPRNGKRDINKCLDVSETVSRIARPMGTPESVSYFQIRSDILCWEKCAKSHYLTRAQQVCSWKGIFNHSLYLCEVKTWEEHEPITYSLYVVSDFLVEAAGDQHKLLFSLFYSDWIYRKSRW